MRCLQERIACIKLDGTLDKTHAHTYAHTHTHTHTHTHEHARKGIHIISLIIFKRKVTEGDDEWFKLATNLIHGCIDVVAHIIRIWKNEFHCTQGLLPIFFNAFLCLHKPNPGEGRCVAFDYTSAFYCLSSTI